MIDDSPETGAGEMETPIEFTYLDATTMKVVARDDDFEEVYTVTLDAAGRAVKVVSEGESVVWTTSYDAAGYAQSCMIEDPTKTSYDFRPRADFTWSGGNLMQTVVPAVAGSGMEDYVYDFAYSDLSNDPERLSIDLNAFFGAVPTDPEDDGVCGILALAGLMGERSAFLTTSSADEYDVPGMPDDPQSEYRYVSEGSALPMVWTCDGEGYPVRADATYELRVYKEHKVTGERTLVRTTSYRSRYEVLYAE